MFMSHKTAVGSFAEVIGSQSFHFVTTDDKNVVTRVSSLREQRLWISGGFFIFLNEVFDYIEEGDELVETPFARRVAERKLMACPCKGFRYCMGTLKDKMALDRMEADGACHWKVWQHQIEGSRRVKAKCQAEGSSSHSARNRYSAVIAP
jgi:glucose-1-phosphate cytidylyltransferase